jgi:hypothetical protein
MDEILPSLATIIENAARAQRETFARCGGRPCGTAVGGLNAYQWLQFIAAHEKQQMKPMREIAETLPKTVTSLHK